MIALRVITALFCVFVAVPLLWLVWAAFLPAEAIVQANLATLGFSLQNFLDLPHSGLFRALGISLLATGLVVAGQLGFGLGAAYAIPIIYVPLLMITHIAAFYMLMRPPVRQASV